MLSNGNMFIANRFFRKCLIRLSGACGHHFRYGSPAASTSCWYGRSKAVDSSFTGLPEAEYKELKEELERLKFTCKRQELDIISRDEAITRLKETVQIKDEALKELESLRAEKSRLLEENKALRDRIATLGN